ncbi:doublecortin domain-containing protein 1 [Gracilinanus agilis]|uniref:doublecortin domain-containing protein 1 n=1 Tax=Gracilinanus agilis TaxID=191870 RepID=UPI001CFEF39C|nr:doublecortin domain-containing protein 1 [Gracilinanus agilis]
MYRTENLILGAHGAIMVGVKVVVSKPEVWTDEEAFRDPDESQREEKCLQTENISQETLDSSTKVIVPGQKYCKYAWQQNSPNSEDVQEEDKLSKNVESYRKLSHELKDRVLNKGCHQQFEFRDGHIFNSPIPRLVLGVQRFNLRSGSDVILVRKNSYDKRQRWLHKEDSRTFHLMSNPKLVLAVAIPTDTNEDAAEITSYPVIVQKYKPYGNGASNQKWGYLKNRKVLKAFYSTKLDIEVTTANYVGVCTSSVAKDEEINQVGYYFRLPGRKTKIMVCLACAKSLIGQKEVKKLPPTSKFLCAFGSKEQKQFSLKYLNVIGTNQLTSGPPLPEGDLAPYEAEDAIRHYEDLLLSFQRKASTHTLSHNILATMRQTPVKIIAHRNGTGCSNGKLVIAQSFPMLLSGCTVQLGLTRAASRLYTYDGTTILNLNDLILWAVSETLKHKSLEVKKYALPEENKEIAILSKEDKKTNQGEIKTRSHSSSARRNSINSGLLTFILKTPIEVWVSCGEPFIPLDALQRSEKLERANWLKKDKILADLDVMKHKMRQLKGRRVLAPKISKMVPTKNHSRHGEVKGWSEPSQEEKKLLEHIESAEAQLSEVQSLQTKRSPVVSLKQSSLYTQPNTKRVLAYIVGNKREDGIYAWGRSINELLDQCSTRLRMTCPAKTLYTPDGKRLTSWNDIKREMVICVSSGNHFVNHKESKKLVDIQASSAHNRKQMKAHAADIVAPVIESSQSKTDKTDSVLSLYTSPALEGWGQVIFQPIKDKNMKLKRTKDQGTNTGKKKNLSGTLEKLLGKGLIHPLLNK